MFWLRELTVLIRHQRTKFFEFMSKNRAWGTCAEQNQALEGI